VAICAQIGALCYDPFTAAGSYGVLLSSAIALIPISTGNLSFSALIRNIQKSVCCFAPVRRCDDHALSDIGFE
jgi:hypothetical protein